jgi:uncharacterized protein YbjT (DUF2867 family)
MEKVLVVGATGGVGQLTVAKLLEKGWSVRVLTRSSEKARQMFGERVEVAVGDIRDAETLPPAFSEITHLICTTGTTAFPSARWEFELPASLNGWQRFREWVKIYTNSEYGKANAKNSPEKVDAQGIQNLVNIAPQNLQRFVFVSSCGIQRKDKPPYSILNAFGVLDAKQQGEQAIIQSGLPYTIIRPARLIDGPYTSYDLNTLFKAKTEGKLGVILDQGDQLSGQTSRIDVANACVECLSHPVTLGKIFEIINQGTRPVNLNWGELFSQLA